MHNDSAGYCQVVGHDLRIVAAQNQLVELAAIELNPHPSVGVLVDDSERLRMPAYDVLMSMDPGIPAPILSPCTDLMGSSSTSADTTEVSGIRISP
jgi:hypothetical protein